MVFAEERRMAKARKAARAGRAGTRSKRPAVRRSGGATAKRAARAGGARAGVGSPRAPARAPRPEGEGAAPAGAAAKGREFDPRKMQEVKSLITLGRKKGMLTYEEVNDLLPEGVTSPEKIDEILMLFDELGIEVRSEEHTSELQSR